MELILPGKGSLHLHEIPKYVERLQAKLTRAEKVIEFYAEPDTYFGIGFLPDRPCGEFIDDVSETIPLGYKPGKKAREYLKDNKE